ncbi:MAG: methylase [Anaerostipes sp.]|nr:methylase [Anaerostipes sp.]
MTGAEQREAARQFYHKWYGRGQEDADDRSYWIDILQDIFGVTKVTDYIEFQKRVIVDGHTKRIDAYIPETKVLIEQKSLGKKLDQKIHQSGDIDLTPYEQAKRYNDNLPFDEKARWIVVSNFAEIWIYDMNAQVPEPSKLSLENLQNEIYRLDFLVEKNRVSTTQEMDVSIKAGKLVGKLYDELLKQYGENPSEHDLKSLNMLCVRIVFCLYAEDAGLFGKHAMFHDYLEDYKTNHMHTALRSLFKVLDQKPEDRYKFLEPELAAFPYVNGGLFSDDTVDIPPFTERIRDLILKDASAEFNWSSISPTIFGAAFESTLNPETRRAGGMHYTSIEKIHRVIDPLFLDGLKEELENIKANSVVRTQREQLKKYQKKLASLTFLDPACGSGNFLTETFLCLRRLENEVLKLRVALNKKDTAGQISFGWEDDNPIEVSIQQFYGMEINDFAVTVAKTALWIAESQMIKETEDVIRMNIDFLPLKSYTNIVECNALSIEWNNVIQNKNLNYIMGNPPFIGARQMDQGSPQKREVEKIFGKIKDVQDLDYVTCWYKKSAEYIQGTNIEVGLVSTNSICQGSQVPILWNVLLDNYNIHINYAHQTFRWDNESTDNAAVFCVIIGFSTFDRQEKLLYTYKTVRSEPEKRIVSNIGPYLLPSDNMYVVAQKNAICDVPKMNFGNQPRDGGFFVIKENEREEILKKEPELERWLHPYIGADEFIKGKKRWCLWLKGISPSEIKKSKILYEKVECVRQFRLDSRAKTTNGYAKVPHLFAQITQPDDVEYLMIPRVSSERRRYVPIGFMNSNVISSDAVQIVPNATLYHFGVLTSNVHMAWMRTVAGRLKADYRYSKEIVYNTFPWPNPSDAQKEKIEKTAQEILDARAMYSDSSFSELYDPSLMPLELQKAHNANNRAVMQAYGFSVKDMSEADCVAALMELYQKKVEG